jgi:hypothetical protein
MIHTTKVNEEFDNESKCWDIASSVRPKIKDSIKAIRIKDIDDRIREVEGMNPECTCSCEFKDGCLCREERDGFNILKVKFLTSLRKDKAALEGN